MVACTYRDGASASGGERELIGVEGPFVVPGSGESVVRQLLVENVAVALVGVGLQRRLDGAHLGRSVRRLPGAEERTEVGGRRRDARACQVSLLLLPSLVNTPRLSLPATATRCVPQQRASWPSMRCPPPSPPPPRPPPPLLLAVSERRNLANPIAHSLMNTLAIAHLCSSFLRFRFPSLIKKDVWSFPSLLVFLHFYLFIGLTEKEKLKKWKIKLVTWKCILLLFF